MKYRGGFEGKGFEDEIRTISRLGNKTLDVGFFDEKHPYADMTFAELAKFHAHGGTSEKPVIERDVIGEALAVYPFDKDKKASEALFRWLDNPSNPDELLSMIGQDYVDKIKNIFGSSLLSPTPFNPDPLIDTGALKESTTYKITSGG